MVDSRHYDDIGSLVAPFLYDASDVFKPFFMCISQICKQVLLTVDTTSHLKNLLAWYQQ